jgi:hypothetical protein
VLHPLYGEQNKQLTTKPFIQQWHDRCGMHHTVIKFGCVTVVPLFIVLCRYLVSCQEEEVLERIRLTYSHYLIVLYQLHCVTMVNYVLGFHGYCG